VLGDDLRDPRAQTAIEIVCLRREDKSETTQDRNHVVHRVGIEAGHDDNRGLDSLGRQQVRDLYHLAGHIAHGDEEEIAAFANNKRPAQLESAVYPGNDGFVVFSEPVIHRTRKVPGLEKSGACLLMVCWDDDRQAGLRAHDANILQAVVGKPGRPILKSAANSNDSHRQMVENRTVADELESA